MAARSFSVREKRLIQAAVVLAIVVLISLLFRGGGGSAPAPGPAAPAVSASAGPTYAGPPPQAYASPPPAAPSSVSAAPLAPPTAPAADISSLKLYGLLASGAVIGTPNGGQRLVPVGREALPGLILVRIEQNQAIFQGAGGEVRLGLDGAGQAGSTDPATATAR